MVNLLTYKLFSIVNKWNTAEDGSLLGIWISVTYFFLLYDLIMLKILPAEFWVSVLFMLFNVAAVPACKATSLWFLLLLALSACVSIHSDFTCCTEFLMKIFYEKQASLHAVCEPLQVWSYVGELYLHAASS